MTVSEQPTSEWVAIGDRIRRARTAARLSVRELARRVGVSPSHVSQVERGLASFSVRALYNVVNELGISMDSLFDDATVVAGPVAAGEAVVESEESTTEHDAALVAEGIVLRAGARPTIPLAGGTRWERLTPLPESGAEFIEVVYPPAPGEGPRQVDFIQHSAREYGVVTSGRLTVQVGFESSVLGPGDSIAFDSVIPHRFWNETAEEVRAVWFIRDSPREPADGAGPTTGPAGPQGH